MPSLASRLFQGLEGYAGSGELQAVCLHCFRGFEDRIRQLGAIGAWLCCVLLIGFGLSPAAIAQERVTYIHPDALGSVVAESDANGNVIKRYD